MNILTGMDSQNHKYSIERLRRLYGDLLKCIDYENHHVLLEARHQEAETSPRFGLRRKVFWFKNKDKETDVDERTEQRRRYVSAAFLSRAATRSIAQEGLALRDPEEDSEGAIEIAKSLENSVVQIIRSIGEVVVNAEGRQPTDATKKDLRSDPAFEYFCEKAILALFVEIACETPVTGGGTTHSVFHGVVWSPRVKAQIFHTVSLLVAGVRDSSALCYLLSQNCMNQLVAGMLPLQQWTDPALEIMLPPYVEMIKTLSLQLGDSPHLFPFFTVQHEDRIHFPLFSATLMTGTSSFAESNSFVHATCLNLMVELLQIPYSPIQDYLCEAAEEQQVLADHLCALLLRRYTRMVQLTTGPVVDGIRSSAMDSQIKGLNDQLELLDDVFLCPLQGLQIRLCEKLLQKLVVVLWKSCGSGERRPLLSLKGIPSVGVPDTDVIPASEASAQVAFVFLSQFLAKVTYTPAIRMLGVALWHEQASPLWKEDGEDSQSSTRPLEEYAYTKALHSVVSGKLVNLVPNMFRAEYYKTLRGDYGEWRVISAAALMYQCLQVLDSETLDMLQLVPNSAEATPLETAIAEFFQQTHERVSNVSCTALECIASLSMKWLQCTVKQATRESGGLERLRKSPVMSGLRMARNSFFESTTNKEEIVGVSDLFVDIVEATVLSCYRRITLSANGVRSASRTLGYNLSQIGCCRILNNGETLVRKLHSVPTNDVESSRFHIQMALLFRAVWRVMEGFFRDASRVKSEKVGSITLDMIDKAEELTTIFGGLREKPSAGSDIDIRGRVSFPFFIDNSAARQEMASREHVGRDRALSADTTFRASATLVVVLDPTDLYIVNPLAKHDFTRGSIVCCVPLLNVVASAADNDWLHIAVRHEDVGLLIKNGNMALHFDTSGTALIVGNYIDRSRRVLRGELVRKIQKLFDAGVPDSSRATGRQESVELSPASSQRDHNGEQSNNDSSTPPPSKEEFTEDKKEVDPADIAATLHRAQLEKDTQAAKGQATVSTLQIG